MKKRIAAILVSLVFSLSLICTPVTTVNAALGSKTPDNVVMTWLNSPKTSKAFTWRTSKSITKSVVQYVKSNEFKDFTSSNVITINGTSNFLDTNAGKEALHYAELTNLTPGTSYTYRVGDGSTAGWSEAGTFTTEDDKNKNFTFIHFGDSQLDSDSSSDYMSAYATFGAVAKKALEMYPETKFVYSTGDIIDSGEDQNEWDAWFKNSKFFLKNTTFMCNNGNHEDLNSYLAQFQLPQNGPEGFEGRDYSFDYGDVHFVALDDCYYEGDSSEEADRVNTWLRNDLASSNKKFKIVMLHRNLYSLGDHHEEDVSVFQSTGWAKIFEDTKVDLVLGGHDHIYSKTNPVKGGKIVAQGEGPVYIVGGASGEKFYPLDKSTAFSYDPNIFKFPKLTLDGNKRAKSITPDDTFKDVFSAYIISGNQLNIMVYTYDKDSNTATMLDTYTITK